MTHQDSAYQYDYSLKLGPWTSYSLLTDPIHLTFVLSRYKFCAKLLASKRNVLEIGCGDAVGTPIVAQFTKRVLAIDIDEKIILSNKMRLAKIKNIEFQTLDFLKNIPNGKFAGVYSIDVIEHLEKRSNGLFIKNIRTCLDDDGICIVGTPNITSQHYASRQSKKFHINLHSHKTLSLLLSRHFRNIFLFSMNDEVVHTGFFPMSHYLFGVGVGLR